MAEREAGLDRRYIAAIAAIAVAILAGGLLLKPSKRPEAPPPTANPSFQRLLRAEELRSMIGYLQARVDAVAPSVLALSDRDAAAVVVGRPGQAVTAPASSHSETPLEPVNVEAATVPVLQSASLPDDQELLLAVARGPRGTIWDTAMYHGVRDAQCGPLHFQELIVDVPASVTFDGAGIFSLDGGLLGLAGRCAGERVVVASGSIPAALDWWRSPRHQRIMRYGLSAAPLDETARAYFKADTGLLVDTVWIGSPADRSGLQPGDIVPEAAFPSTPESGELRLPVRRNGKTVELVIYPAAEQSPPAGLGAELEPAVANVPTLRVNSASAAYRAGLRDGDRVLQPAPAALRRVLDGTALPAYVILERGQKRIGVMLTR